MRTNHSLSFSKVKALIRVRPFLDKESDEMCVQVIKPKEHGSVQLIPKSIKHCNLSHLQVTDFSFDGCYDMDSTQEQIYKEQILPLVPGMFQGLNTTIFAYGISGSGKTFTMQGNSAHPGLLKSFFFFVILLL